MARCTAPVRGHTRGGGADCPACGSRYRRGYGGGYPFYSSPSYSSYSPFSGGGSSRSSAGGSARTQKPRWSPANSPVYYTSEQVRAFEPIRENVESRAKQPELWDAFLCHAWDDRQGSAKELHDLLKAGGVRVWFSEKHLGLGVPMMRAIDKGLVNSRVGIVLVTQAMLRRLTAEGIAE